MTTAKQARRAERAAHKARKAAAHVRGDWEYTGLMLIRCEQCGCKQTNGIDEWDDPRPCVVCGHGTGTFAGWIEPDPRDVPRKLSPDGPFALAVLRTLK